MKDFFVDFYRDVLKKPFYSIPLVLHGLVAYLSSICLKVSQFEEFQTWYYYGKGNAVISGRWGHYLWMLLFSVFGSNSVLTKLIAFLLFLLAAILIAAIFYFLNRDASTLQLLVLSGGVLTFPLIHEIWNYRMNLTAVGNIAVVAFSLLLVLIDRLNWKSIVIAAGLMTIPVASYESCIFCYLLLVVCILFYRDLQEHITARSYLNQGIRFIIPLALALGLRFLVTAVILKALHLNYVSGGAVTPEWVHGRFPLGQMLRDTVHDYFLKGLVYFPITIFACCFFGFVLFCVVRAIKDRHLGLLLSGLLVLIAVFLQGIVQLLSMPYRTAQPMSIFAGFVLLLAVETVRKLRPAVLRYALCGLVLFLIYRQGVYLNEIFLLDAQVAENDEAMARNIGYRLMTEFEEKGVYFCLSGEDRSLYAQWNGIIGNGILEEITYDPETLSGRLYAEGYRKLYDGEEPPRVLIQSDLFSTMQLLGTVPWALRGYFSYLGYDINILYGDEYHEKSEQIIKEQQLRRYDIYDAGDFLLVCLE